MRITALPDATVDKDLRNWLDGNDEPLAWHSAQSVTPDEYFFITTLYGNMNLAGQRTMIRNYFGPLFVRAAKRDIGNFRPETPGYEGLRAPFMKARLCRMGAILRECGISMAEYVEKLRSLERKANAENPTPALDRIVQDHQATGVKTLSVFVRDWRRRQLLSNRPARQTPARENTNSLTMKGCSYGPVLRWARTLGNLHVCSMKRRQSK